MALTFGDIQRLKWELGYNTVNVGAEAYVLNGYAAMFDAAIEPYLFDQGSTSTTVVTAAAIPTVVSITLASNPPVTGATVNVYGNVFTQGALVTVDVGPNQEQNVVILGLTGLVASVQLQNSHGAYGSYPVILQGGEYRVRQILARLDVIDGELSGSAPFTAGLKAADEAQFYSSEHGRRGSRNAFDDLNAQRDLARKDLAAALGVPNLWEMRGKFGGAGGLGLTYELY